MSAFRSDVECLRAENERLTARVAELEAKPMVEKKRKPEAVSMRWTVGWLDDGRSFVASACAALYALVVVLGVLAVTGHWITNGNLPTVTTPDLRFAAVMAVLALAWCLAFVRRVPR